MPPWRLLSRLSLRAQLLIPAGLVLALMLVLALSAVRALNRSARTARSFAKEVTLVETLRDSNSRAFESDRWQHLALRATTVKDFKESRTEALDVMDEAIEGFQTFARTARTPALRAEAAKHVTLLETIGADRAKALELAGHTVGRPVDPAVNALVDRLEGRTEAMDVANDKMVTGEQEVTDDLAAQAAAEASNGRRLVLGLLVAAVLLGAGLSLLLARRLLRNARQLSNAARGIAAGDVDQQLAVNGTDELAQTAAAFGDMVDYLRGIATAGERIGAGDLTVDVEPRGDADVLGHAFHRMTGSLRETIGGVAQTAVDVNAASREVAETINQTGDAVGAIANAMTGMAEGAAEQLERVAGARRSAADVDDAVNRTTELTSRTTEVAEGANDAAQAGLLAAERAVEAMAAVRDASEDAAQAIGTLELKSGEIGAIVETISGIADQTNLLALNAAIEAARAGEQGRGFAVVAEEVRRLAEDASQAAGRIGRIVDEIRVETRNTVTTVTKGAERTNAGAETVAETSEALERVRVAIDDITGRVGEIAAAASVIEGAAERLQDDLRGVADVAERSSEASGQVSASTQQSSAATEQIAASALELSESAERLEQMVAGFSVASRG